MNVVLDLDGTLISCEQRQLAVLRAALITHGLTADLSKIWKIKREGASTLEALIMSGFTTQISQIINEEWKRMIEDYFWLCLDNVLPTVLDTIREINKCANLALLTARNRPELVNIQLERLGLAIYFNEIIAVPASKPIENKATWLLNLSASSYFADTEVDARAAMLANVPFFAVSTGQRDPEYLIKLGISNPYENLEDAWSAFKLTL